MSVIDAPLAAVTRRPASLMTGGGPLRRLLAWGREHAMLVAVLAAALLVSELPRLLAACCAPAGATGLGTAWFVNDFAQYESAMRQGAEQAGWLVHDPFTAEPHAPTFMFPLYVALGKLAATLHLPAASLEHGLELVARVLLVVGLWRFCQAFASGRGAAPRRSTRGRRRRGNNPAGGRHRQHQHRPRRLPRRGVARHLAPRDR